MIRIRPFDNMVPWDTKQTRDQRSVKTEILLLRQRLKCGLAIAEVVTFGVFALDPEVLASSATPKLSLDEALHDL